MKLVGAQPTSLTPAPTTDLLTPHTVPTQHRTMETPELGGPLSETAPLTTLLGLLGNPHTYLRFVRRFVN